jgi:hypothetical protein
MTTHAARLVGLRGAAYYEEFARIWAEVRTVALASIAQTRTDSGNFKIGDLIRLIDWLDLPCKPTVLMLEREGIFHTGVWDVMERDGFSLKRMREELRRKEEATT